MHDGNNKDDDFNKVDDVLDVVKRDNAAILKLICLLSRYIYNECLWFICSLARDAMM